MSQHDSHHSHSGHKKTYIAIWLALLALTYITVAVSYKDFGELNMVVAMLVATVKASLVALYFMHLKEDKKLNQVVFASSFLFFALLIGFSIGDTMTRQKYTAVKIREIQEPEWKQSSKMSELRKSTPDLVAQGQQLYIAQCASCHGDKGLGDGPAAGGIKPRNFTAPDSDWKNGRAPAQLFKTLTQGIASGGMPAFSTLSVEKRWALVHFVHEKLVPNAPSDTPKTLELIGIKGDGETQKPQEEVQLPIQFAIERMLKEEKP